MANDYSPRWFTTFLESMPLEWTHDEIVGITRRLPLPEFRTVLDICCGSGRHAGPLAAAGYEVTGVDRDTTALARAIALVPAATFVELDQRALADLPGRWDAAMIMWQSFGYFDPAGNDAVLADIHSRLRPGGRLLLDVYHPGFVHSTLGTQTRVRSPDCRSVTNEIVDGRLISTIEYADGSTDTMAFELLEPDDLIGRARARGYRLVEACTRWDSARPPSAGEQRYQVVLDVI
jgi:SAM-dependent methyltransferase